jgi:ankyrin repeat protein
MEVCSGCVRVLINDGKANVNVKDRDGTTPLHVAASNGDNDIVVLLLQAGAQPNTRNAKGLSLSSLIFIITTLIKQ